MTWLRVTYIFSPNSRVGMDHAKGFNEQTMSASIHTDRIKFISTGFYQMLFKDGNVQGRIHISNTHLIPH